MRIRVGCGLLLFVASTFALAAAPGAPASSMRGAMSEEVDLLEKEIASLMMRRVEFTGERRVRLELQIDLRIIRRAVTVLALDARPDTPEQINTFLRSRQFNAASAGIEEAVPTASWTPTDSQKAALAALHKLSFAVSEVKTPKDLDEFCRISALAMVNVVNATPVDPRQLLPMRPKPAGATVIDTPRDTPPTVAELSEQVMKLAAVSNTLRQQLVSLAGAAGEKEGAAAYDLLLTSVNIASGLQSNTAVAPDQRSAIETQLAEGIALFNDPRTKGLGKKHIEQLGAYRQILNRIGKLPLNKEQLQQLAPALTWASSAGDAGFKYLTSLEHYFDAIGRWDKLPRDTGIMPAVKKPLDDLAAQFTKVRTGFWQSAARSAPSIEGLNDMTDDLRRMTRLADDLCAMATSIETLNTFKPKPAGALEKKIVTSAAAAVAPLRSATRNDAEKFLDAVHNLAVRAQLMNARSTREIPLATSKDWAGGKLDAFEARTRTILTELTNSLTGPALELDKARLARLDAALGIADSLRLAVQLDAALPRIHALVRWADWSIDPAALTSMVSMYRESLAYAVTSYGADQADGVDRWQGMANRFIALSWLVVRDSGYADQCQSMPLGLGGDLARLATSFEGQPFATERYASYTLGQWAIAQRAGDMDTAGKMLSAFARRVARDLKIPTQDETGPRRPRAPRP